MSAQQTYKIGERVRVVRPTADLKAGQIVTIEGFECTDGVAYADVGDGTGAAWDLNRFEKVEPEFVVGQQVSGEDYARLPVMSAVCNPNGTTLTKVSEDGWLRDDGSSTSPHSNGAMSSNFTGRTLTHLGDGTHAEPEVETEQVVRVERVLHIKGTSDGLSDVGAACGHELMAGLGANPKHVGHSRSSFIAWVAGGGRDLSPTTDACADCVALATEPEGKVDLYIETAWDRAATEPSVDNSEDATEPEPLKEGTPVLVWAVVERPEIDSDGEVLLQMHGDGGGNGYAYTRPDAIVRPTDGATPPWVKEEKPVRCGSVYMPAAHVFTLRHCEHSEGHDGEHMAGFGAWTDAEAYGRVEVSS